MPEPGVVQLTLTPSEEQETIKCALCGTKCPPHPAILKIDKGLGEGFLQLCAKCDVAVTKLASYVGPGHARFAVGSSSEYQQREIDFTTGEIKSPDDDDQDGDGDDGDDDEGGGPGPDDDPEPPAFPPPGPDGDALLPALQAPRETREPIRIRKRRER